VEILGETLRAADCWLTKSGWGWDLGPEGYFEVLRRAHDSLLLLFNCIGWVKCRPVEDGTVRATSGRSLLALEDTRL